MKYTEEIIRGKVYEICESLFQTGFNKAKNNVKYFPESPAKFRTDQIMKLISLSKQETLKEVEKAYEKGHSHAIRDWRTAIAYSGEGKYTLSKEVMENHFKRAKLQKLK